MERKKAAENAGKNNMGGRRGASARLSREDWVRMAYKMLSENGARSLNVEALAKRLGVTKGSFYWHFKDRAELLEGVLGRWHVQLVIERTEASGGSPTDRLRYMLNIVMNARRPGRGGSLELAMRSWARRDPRVAEVVESVDIRRLEYTAGLFKECGYSDAEAEARAMLLFSYIFSQGILSFGNNRVLDESLHTACCRLIEGELERMAAE